MVKVTMQAYVDSASPRKEVTLRDIWRIRYEHGQLYLDHSDGEESVIPLNEIDTVCVVMDVDINTIRK